MQTLKKIFLAFSMLGLTSTLFAQLDLTTDPKCREAQSELRKLFVDYKPGQGLNLKYLEDLYYTCEAPHPRSTIIYYYLKSANLLKTENNYIEPPSDLFRYFYKEFEEASEAAPEVAKQDPDFDRLLQVRTKELADKFALAENSAGKPVLEMTSAAAEEVAIESISEDPIFGNANANETATATRSIGTPESGTQGAVTPKGVGFPYYPLPVEASSAHITLPNRAFRKFRTLGEVDAHLQALLNEHGYYSRDYFSVADGFTLVTQLERIHADGTPEDDWERWKTAVTLNEKFGLREYFLSLVFAQPGYYRAFAYVVAPEDILDDPFAGNGRLNESEWRISGKSKLPPRVGALNFESPPYQVTVFVFEFEVPANEGNARLVMSGEQGGKGLSAQQHLVGAGLWDVLTK